MFVMGASRRLAPGELALARLGSARNDPSGCWCVHAQRLLCASVFSHSCTWHLSLQRFAVDYTLCARLSVKRRRQGGPGCAFWRRNFTPAGYTCTPLRQLSLHVQSCLVLPAVNGHTRNTRPLFPQIFFVGIKVSDSIRGLQKMTTYGCSQIEMSVAFFFNDQFLANTG